VLIIEAQKTIAGKLGITPQKFEESETNLMEKGLAQNLFILQSSLRSKVK
jgi:predicted transcriptional regulator